MLKSIKSETNYFNAKGQSSIELLLVLTSFTAAFLLFIPLINNSLELGVFSMNVLKARNFLGNLENALQKNILFNAEAVIEEKPGLDWFFEAKNSKAFIEVKSRKLGKSKLLSIDLPADIDFNKTRFSEKISLRIPAGTMGKQLIVND